MEKPRLPSPSGLPGPLPSFWGGAQCVRGPKSCPLTPGEVRRTSTLERGSQWARNQVPTPAWGQARHQLRCRPSRTAQHPAAVRTTAWQRRRSVHGSAARPPGVWNQHPPGDAVHSHYPRLLPREDQALGPGHSSSRASPVQTASPRLGPHCTQRARTPVLTRPVFNQGGDKPGAGKTEQPQKVWWGVPLPSPGLRALPRLSCS